MSRSITKCPECGKPLQATLKVYLKDIEIRDDGMVMNSEPATNLYGETSKEFGDFRSVINKLAAIAEGNELYLYCEDDHEFEVSAYVDSMSNKEPHEDSPSLEDTTSNHADPRNR